MPPISHENVTKSQHLGGREEYMHRDISDMMSMKIRCFANHVEQRSPVKTQQTFTLYSLVN